MDKLKYIKHRNKKINQLLKKIAGLHPRDIDLSLIRIKRLLAKLKNPQSKINNVIHIAGTNGKGSTATIIFQLQMKSGRKVNIYRSPHLLLLNERIFIQNQQISDSYLFSILNYVYKKNNNEPITFFELFTAATLFAFSENPSDVNILEVGLGGRFDATNVFNKKKISIITSIGLDHKNYLGDDVISIAREKAGIINNNSIVICSKQTKIVQEYLKERIDKKKVKSLIFNKEWKIINKVLYHKEDKIDLSALSLNGRHQYFNAACAVLACKEIRDLDMQNEIITKGLGDIHWPGRLQKVEGKIKAKYKKLDVWIDAAHNELGFEVLKDWVIDRKLNKLVMILGLGVNKDIIDIMPKIKKINPKLLCLVRKLRIGNHDPKNIELLAKKFDIETIISENLQSSLEISNKLMKKMNIKNLLITGSISLISEVLEFEEN